MIMKNYQINEGILTLPSHHYEDISMNILNFYEYATSLIISRSKLPPKETLATAMKSQMDELKKSMEQFEIIDRKQSTWGIDTEESQSLEGLEYRIRFKADTHFVTQYQFMSAIGDFILLFSYGKRADLDTSFADSAIDEAHWELLRTTFNVSSYLTSMRKDIG